MNLFFWRRRENGSHEFKPEVHPDHALVLAVMSPRRMPGWKQLRFLHHVLPPKEQRIFWIAILVAIASACAGFAQLARPHIATVAATGGTVTEALVGSPKLINPLYAPLNDVDRDLAALIYSGLFRLDRDTAIQPDLAASYQWLDNGQTLQIVLRKDAQFHDHEPVTADDVVFTYQTLQDPNWRSPLSGDYRNISKVIRVDDQTVQFQLVKPDPGLLGSLTLGILPAHVWADVSDATVHLAEANIKPIGSGPYAVESFSRDSKGDILYYQLKRFPQYYGTAPFIDHLKFRFYADRDLALTAVKQNQVDAFAFVPWGEAETLKNANFSRLTLELPQETIAFFNTQDAVLKDDRVRQALTLAVDRAELVSLMGGGSVALTTPFPYLSASTGTAADLDASRKLLDAAKWELKDGASVRTLALPTTAAKKKKGATTDAAAATSTDANASSTELALTISVPDQADLLKVADYLKRRWSLIGIKVDVQSADAETLLRDATNDRAYQILIWNILLPATQDLTAFWSSAAADKPGLNFSNLRDASVDAGLNKIQDATSTEALAAARLSLSQAILAKTPAAFLLRPTYAYLVSNHILGLKDLRLNQPSDRLVLGATWYIQTTWKLK